MNWWGRLGPVEPRGRIAVVDGGGTRCRVAVVDDDGTLRGWALGGPTNARSAGAEQALDHLCTTIDAAVADAGLRGGDIGLCLTTSASIDTAEISDFLSAGIGHRSLPEAAVPVVPDTLGCWAVTADLRPAVIVIAGTGSVVLAADRDRQIWDRLGGWDFVLGDEGSGYALGRAALREVMFVSEGRSTATDLAAAVLAAYGVADADHVGDKLHGADHPDHPDVGTTDPDTSRPTGPPAIDKAAVAGLAPVLLAAAEAGDPRAVELVHQAPEPLAAAVAVGLARLPGVDPVPLGLFGGTFASPLYREAFLTSVTELTAHRPFEVTAPRTAIVGAVQMAVAMRGADLDTARAAADHFEPALQARTA